MFNARLSTDEALGVLIVSIPVLFVILWYLIMQNGASSYDFTAVRNERIISSFRSILSHIDLGHLLLNVVVYLLYSVPLVFIYKNRYIIVLLFSGILIEIAKYTEYIHIFGMSGYVKFIGGCLLLSFLYTAYVGKINNNLVMTKTIPYIVLVATIPPTVGDILIVTEVVNTSNLGQASYLFYGSIPNTYTKVSAVVHIDGFISGLSLTSGLIILSQQVDIEVFKR